MLKTSAPTDSARERTTGDRASIVLVIALVVVLALPLALENVRILKYWQPKLRGPYAFVGDDLVAAAVKMEDSQAQNVIVTEIARDLADGTPIEMIYGPADLQSITDLPMPHVLNSYLPVIDARLLRAFSGNAFRRRRYDPVLTDAQIAAFDREGRIEEYALAVAAVHGDSPSTVFVLHTDEAGHRLFVVPIDLSPASAKIRR